MAKIYAPDPNFYSDAGTVQFRNGVATVADDAQGVIALFKRHGFRVELDRVEPVNNQPLPAEKPAALAADAQIPAEAKKPVKPKKPQGGK